MSDQQLREERLFIEDIGPSLNNCLRQTGWMIYKSAKKSIGTAMQVAGAQHLEPFTKPIELWYLPLVTRGKSGHISKQYDCLNFGITYKIIEDWLVKLGLIPDDNRDWVHSAHCLRCQLATDGRMGVKVLIREVDDAAVLGRQEGLELPPERPF